MTWLKSICAPLFAAELTRLSDAEQEITLLQQETAALSGRVIELEAAAPEVIVHEVFREAREFSSYEELRLWLRANSVSEREYSAPDQDCDDFARQTQQAALADGYIINVEYDPSGYYHKDGQSHMVCTAVINDHLYIFDPQTDTMLMDGPLD